MYSFLIFHLFQCFSSYSRSYSVCVSFSTFFSFLAILHVLQCAFLIFLVFECFSPYSRSYSVHFSFSTFFSISRYIEVPKMVIPHYSHFSMFFAIFTSYSMCFSISIFFFTFLTIFQVLQCHFSFSTFLSFSRHITGQKVFVESFLAIIHVLKSVFLIFHVFQCFSPYFTSYSVCFSFSMMFTFLAILQVLPCAFLIFQDFECF